MFKKGQAEIYNVLKYWMTLVMVLLISVSMWSQLQAWSVADPLD